MADRASFDRYPLIDALRERRSRRFGRGMSMETGPLEHRSRLSAVPLDDDEEALLAFAACGITGPVAGDLIYEPGHGGAIMAGWTGRTVASGDAIQTVSLAVVNDRATYVLRRPRDFPPAEIPQLVAMARDGAFTELYRRSRIKIRDGRVAPPLDPLYNLDVNRWSLYDPGATYLLPINDLTLLYINGVLEIFGRSTGAFVVDERAGFRPAGLGRFAASRGGHLRDDPREQRVLTIQQVESLVTEFVTIEQGMLLQNVALMTEALGLGGFPHWAAHPFGWLRALGFRMHEMPSTRYLGAGRVLRWLARVTRRETTVPLAVGLKAQAAEVLTAYCPPNYPSMEAAVRAVIELKFGEEGVFRGGSRHGAWRDPEAVARSAADPDPEAIDATLAYCGYVHDRYGRFPAYPPPFRTVLGFQAGHVDVEFYDRHYPPQMLGRNQREHMERWHGVHA